MVELGHAVTCYNRKGHHVSGVEFDGEERSEYKGVRLKTVPTIERRIIRNYYRILSIFPVFITTVY